MQPPWELLDDPVLKLRQSEAAATVIAPRSRDSSTSRRCPPSPWICPPATTSSLCNDSRDTRGLGLPHGASWPSDFHSALDVAEKRPFIPRDHLLHVLRHTVREEPASTLPPSSNRVQRYTRRLPSKKRATGPLSSTSALKTVFGEDELGHLATSLFQSALTPGTHRNYASNLVSFYEFCDSFLLNPLAVSPIDIARYISWLGQRDIVAADSLQFYLSVINMMLMDHASHRSPWALS